MRPAGESLDAAHRTAGGVDLGLVGHADGSAGERLAQGGDDGEAPLSLHLVGRLPEDRAAAGVPGAVHRRLGAPHQRGGVVAVLGGVDDADRQPDVRADRADLRAALDARPAGPARRCSASPLAAERDGDGEAAAADAPDQRVAGWRRQAPGDLDQQLVADLVAQGVVHLAEGVDGDGGDDDVGVLGEQGVQSGGWSRSGSADRSASRWWPPARRSASSRPRSRAVGELGADRLEQPQVAHVEAADVAQALGAP